MTSDDLPARREPPPFRRVEVRRVDDLSPRMRRIVLGGEALDGFVLDEPAASVRLLLPRPDGVLELPTWTGNQFELADGSRAPIRTLTPRHHSPTTDELTVDVVQHDGGAVGTWAAGASVGDEAAVSGPGRGHVIDAGAEAHLLVGDETAIPAIDQLLERMPDDRPVRVLIEVARPEARIPLRTTSTTEVTWLDLRPADEPGTAMIDALVALDDVPTSVWVAGEAAAVQRARHHLFDERGLSRSQATVRGYWKKGRSAT